MLAARAFLREAVKSRSHILLLPDKDVDGLCGAAIMHHTLQFMGHTNSSIILLKKGENVHMPSVNKRVKEKKPNHVVVIDQGSRHGNLNFDAPTLIIDHHESEVFPTDSIVLSSFDEKSHANNIAPSSLLTYMCCKPLHKNVEAKLGWLALMGTFGDLGTSLTWPSHFPPELKNGITTYGRKSIATAVSLINAPRRTSECDVASAWEVLINATSPEEISGKNPLSKHLVQMREDVNAEVSRCSRIPPRFSLDGKVALVQIKSAAQIHPVIATRWANTLKEPDLEMVIAANDGYLPDMVNFAARIGKSARSKEAPVNLIQLLRKAVEENDPELMDLLGDNFARGHAQATGGIVTAPAFKRLLACLKFKQSSKQKK